MMWLAALWLICHFFSSWFEECEGDEVRRGMSEGVMDSSDGSEGGGQKGEPVESC